MAQNACGLLETRRTKGGRPGFLPTGRASRRLRGSIRWNIHWRRNLSRRGGIHL
jgi:hypothetical protein